MLRVCGHPYARSNLPSGASFKELYLHGLPLASPFNEKKLELPYAPSHRHRELLSPIFPEAENGENEIHI